MRFGTHVSSAGGVSLAAGRAHDLGCDTLQIFTASPRQWKARPISAAEATALQQLRRKYRLHPLVVHANYLINVASDRQLIRRPSMTALRGELERARAIAADFLVLHPGSGTLDRCVEGIRQAAKGFDWGGLMLLIENMAGGGQHLAGSFAAVAAILDGLDGLPAGACIDTCHSWAAGYDLVTPDGYTATMQELQATVGLQRVPVFHANDAKTARGSHHDRHEHIGDGQLGAGAFRRLLHDPRLRSKAFLVETPPEGQAHDLAVLRGLAK
ncbi:MAG: deoxyribonuclease IV [Terriglobales bacterium]